MRQWAVRIRRGWLRKADNRRFRRILHVRASARCTRSGTNATFSDSPGLRSRRLMRESSALQRVFDYHDGTARGRTGIWCVQRLAVPVRCGRRSLLFDRSFASRTSPVFATMSMSQRSFAIALHRARRGLASGGRCWERKGLLGAAIASFDQLFRRSSRPSNGSANAMRSLCVTRQAVLRSHRAYSVIASHFPRHAVSRPSFEGVNVAE